MILPKRFQLTATAVAAWMAASATGFAEEKLGYNKDIRPILSDKCFQCHGPDSAKREAKLRLDVREEALKKKAFVPGKPEESELVTRFHASDPDEVMPPPDSPRQLNDTEREKLERWIKQGAEYQLHWAFNPLPATTPVPEPKQKDWAKNSIDSFILSRLEQESLSPTNPASPERWLRRVAFDLTGMPVSQPDLEVFLADGSPNAREKAVQKLLDSPHYGEKMAIDWLDVARYADSFGYQSDIDTHAWPYRDWVISAYNQNLPWDQFITWQIAGDLLPNPTREQLVATAFNRIHRMTNEGGSVEEEFRQNGISDRVHTFGFAFLALTFECTKCHDHKYDPLTQKDYYSMGAFFNSIDEWGLLPGDYGIQPNPSLLLPTAEQDQAIAAEKAAIAAATAALQASHPARENAFAAWLKHPTAEWVDLVGSYDFDLPKSEPNPETYSFVNAANAKTPANSGIRNLVVTGHHGQALSFTGDDPLKLGKQVIANSEDPLSMAFWLKLKELGKRMVIFHDTGGKDTGYNGFELVLENGQLRWTVAREWPGNCIVIRSIDILPLEKWTHLTVSYDGSAQAAGLKIYIDGEEVRSEVIRDNLHKNSGSGEGFVFGERMRDSGLRGGSVDDIRLLTRPVTSLEVKALHEGKNLLDAIAATSRDEAGIRSLKDFYRSAVDLDHRNATAELRMLRQKLRITLDGVHELPVMKEDAIARPVHVLARGDYASPAEEALPRVTPAVLPAFTDQMPRNRLGLAQWLTEPSHPLTARVQVNRVWQHFFGRGIVATSENFGSQGELPSHPELLDWLARDFIANGWNMKRLCSQIVLSSTYGQDSKITKELREKDFSNILLSRGPAKRLSGEELRDQALTISGLLQEKIGGPSTKPYLPEAAAWKVINNFLPEYKRDDAPSIYRRSIYTFWRRTAPPPSMLAFDIPGRDVCTVRRQQTNTPLQPLVMLNDPQFVEASRGLAIRMMNEGGADLSSRARWVFREAVGREPQAAEIKLLSELYTEQLGIFQKDPTGAAAYLKVGDLVAPITIPVADLAAATALASAVINLDESITLR